MKKILFIFLFLAFNLTVFSQNTVTKVIDGDTFVIDTGEKVRLLGIDTPEKWESGKLDRDSERTGKDKEVIKLLGQLASDYAEKMLLNQTVVLLSDSTNSDTDRYGRLLRYAYLSDGTLFNLKIIQDGYAYAYTKYPVIYMEEFVKAQHEARENARGLWSDKVFEEMK
ncbi:MAG: thermonuclease family protein [Ignavibacteria bacterium]|nr:thermonuclease family protein [Ignavibacteria bacterium]